MVETQIAPDMVTDLERQREYVERQKSKKDAGMGLVFVDAFLKGMRDIGYKSPATALDELIDNSIQANATRIAAIFGYDGVSKKPTQIAVVDNGHGMLPDMIYFAVKWGGTHRENDRSGFGRYGYGLPSAAISMAKRYTVYSKVEGGEWYSVTVDIEELGAMAERGEKVDMPRPQKAELPQFVRKQKEPIGIDKMLSGTIIVLEELDRLKAMQGWTLADAIKSKLLQEFGVVYRHIVPHQVRIYVEGTEVQVVDPLFLMESGRYYDETPVRARPMECPSFETTTQAGRTGRVRIRASWMPPTFQRENPNTSLQMGRENNRHPIMKDYNGLLICRAGRQIDCIRSFRWTTFQNNDINMKIEIDFDPELDELFGITTSKQQIVIDDAMWNRLDAAGVRKMITEMRVAVEKARLEHAAKVDSLRKENEPRPSEEAMRSSEKFKQKRSRPSPKKTKEAQDNLEDVARREAERSNRDVAEVKREIETQMRNRPYMVTLEPVPEGPFYRPERLSLQRRLIVNTQHPFYTHLYDSPESTQEVKDALEVLLFVLADAELDAEGDYEVFYKSARKDWSERLAHALEQLSPKKVLADKRSAQREGIETEMLKAAGG